MPTIRHRTLALGLLLALGACATGAPRGAGRKGAAAPAEPLFAAVIDAGSSGSRLHLYRWRPAPAGGIPWVEPAWEEKVEPGLSALLADPSRVRESLAPLIRSALERIGGESAALARYPLYLKATGGLRGLPEADRRTLLEAAHAYLETTPFAVAEPEVISGEREGIYGWISVNYLLGYLDDGGPFPSAGALDLGGASTQITFVPLDAAAGETVTLRIGSSSFPLYTHSYLGLGQDAALLEVGSPACYPRGYPIPDGGGRGDGDYRRCREAVRRTVARPCEATRCSLMGVYQPPLYGDFVAFSAYTYAASFFGLGQILDLELLERIGTDYCATEWEAIVRERADQAGNPYLPRHCFTAAFLGVLLEEGYGFGGAGSSIRVPERILGREVSWTLGALLYELTEAELR